MKEIEEIKKIIVDRGYIGYEETLLYFLEQIQEENSELKGQIRVECENNQGWIEELKKVEERVNDLEKLIKIQNDTIVNSEIRINEAEQERERLSKLLILARMEFMKLVEEHKQWAKILGRIFIEGLQGEYNVVEICAKQMKVGLEDGEPVLVSRVLEEMKGEKDESRI